MTKTLKIVCSILLIGSVSISSLVNYQHPKTINDKAKIDFLFNKQAAHVDWQSIIARLPQYALAKLKTPLGTIQKNNVQISDALLIGIIVDVPSSVLVSITHNGIIEIKELNVGQSWLQDWLLHRISPDSAVWRNIKTQELHTQTLFDTSVKAELKLLTGK